MAIGITWGEPHLRKRKEVIREPARREPGWYWIRPNNGSRKEIAEYVSGLWLLTGEFRTYPDDRVTVLSDRLEPPDA